MVGLPNILYMTNPFDHICSDTLLNTFLDLAKIDSPPGKEAQVCQYIQNRLNSLRIPYRVDKYGNLIADIPKHQCEHDDVLVLCAHMDVVPPSENVTPVVTGSGMERKVCSDGSTVLGGDDKAAIAPILEVVAFLVSEQQPRPQLRLIFTTEEESTLQGAKMVAHEDLNAAFGLVFDLAADNPAGFGAIINKAPTLIEFEITLKGKSAHAGMNPENGLNAIKLASWVLEQLPVGQLDPLTTANIGTITGGRSANVVPDIVIIKGEVRSHQQEKVDAYINQLQTILSQLPKKFTGAQYELNHYGLFYQFELPQNHPGIEHIKTAMTPLNLTPSFITTNGGSDANILNNRGLPCAVLTAAYLNPHALNETVTLKHLSQSAQLLESLINAFTATAFSRE